MSASGNSLSRRQFIESLALAAAAASSSLSFATSAYGNASRSFLEYRSLDAMAMAKLVRNGEADPAELLDIAIARANAVQPALNFMTLPHFELAKKQLAKGLPKGPLSGVPFLLKDLGIALEGTVTSEGSRLFKDQLHNQNSTLTQRYLDAGLVIFGKTHSPEFGGTATTETQLWGATRNPWNTDLSAGGSSGGAAAAV